jgi:hypothetical protein
MSQDKYANETILGPSFETCRARQRAAFGKGCKCGKKKDPTEVKQIGSRRWISCHRCLGQIKQLS